MRPPAVVALGALLAWLGAAACGTTPRAGPSPPAREAPRSAASSAATAAAPAAPATPVALAAPAAAALAVDESHRFERVLEGRIESIAVDRPPHVAALGDRSLWISDAKGWKEQAFGEPTMEALRFADERERRLFYGRDYRVRLLVNTVTDAGVTFTYWRWLPGGLRPGSEELGPLAREAPPVPVEEAPRPGYRVQRVLAVLGTEDPEILCRPREICLVKRLSGWSRFPAPKDVSQVAIHGGKAYLVVDRAVLEVTEGKAPRTLAQDGPWKAPSALFASSEAIWVLETESDRLHRFDGQTWHTLSSPVSRPAVLWGANASTLFVGGEGGLVVGDGEKWRTVPAVEGRVRAVLGRNASEIWVGSERGLYRGVPRN